MVCVDVPLSGWGAGIFPLLLFVLILRWARSAGPWWVVPSPDFGCGRGSSLRIGPAFLVELVNFVHLSVSASRYDSITTKGVHRIRGFSIRLDNRHPIPELGWVDISRWSRGVSNDLGAEGSVHGVQLYGSKMRVIWCVRERCRRRRDRSYE